MVVEFHHYFCRGVANDYPPPPDGWVRVASVLVEIDLTEVNLTVVS